MSDSRPTPESAPRPPDAWRIVGSDGMHYGIRARYKDAARVVRAWNGSRDRLMKSRAPYHVEPMYSAVVKPSTGVTP